MDLEVGNKPLDPVNHIRYSPNAVCQPGQEIISKKAKKLEKKEMYNASVELPGLNGLLDLSSIHTGIQQ